MDPLAEHGTNAALDAEWHCLLHSSTITATYTIFFIEILFVFLSCKIMHKALRRLCLPRLVSEFIVGMIIGNVESVAGSMEIGIFETVSYYCTMGYLFVVGLEMDYRAVLRSPSREATIAYSGSLSSFITTLVMYPIINSKHLDISIWHTPGFMIALSLAFSNTASPIVTRLTTDLKISKSEIGRTAVCAGVISDMVSMFCTCVVISFRRSFISDHPIRAFGWGLLIAFVLAIELAIMLKVVPLFVKWINKRNPEGKPMNEFDMLLSLLLLTSLVYLPNMVGFEPLFNSFLVGLFLPKEGRLSNILISKINFMLTRFGWPTYMCWVGQRTRDEAWKNNQNVKWNAISWAKFTTLSVTGVIGKVSGTMIAAKRNGFRLLEAFVLGLLLNVRGYYHINEAMRAFENGLINDNTLLVMVLAIICSILYIPPIVAFMVRRAKSKAHPQMALQWHNSSSELCMLVGIQGPDNIPAIINIIEAVRGPMGLPLTVYAMDLIELTDRVADTLVYGQEMGIVTVTDEATVALREGIGNALDVYVQESGEGLTLRRLLAVAVLSKMHEEICNAAEETGSLLIILPFHKNRVHGEMQTDHPGLREMNQKVLLQAPCSVGILVDRGLRGTNHLLASTSSQSVAVIFVGGNDDREALALASRAAQHSGVNLTAIRFLKEDGNEDGFDADSARHGLEEISKHELEMQRDDECFAEFYQKHVANRSVMYMEKHIKNGAEMVEMLRKLEGLYRLFIVGLGARRNSPLTAGMGNWEECHELGPIGNVLAASEFSLSASVLIVQQHIPHNSKLIVSDEFSIL